MKKLIAVLLGSAMLVSAFALLSGCGRKGPEVRIQGDFSQEATAEEISALETKMNGFADSFMGDVSASDWKFGIQMLSDGTGSVKMNMSMGESNISMTMDTKADVDFTYALRKADTGTAYTGAGTLDVNYSMGGYTENPVSAAVKGSMYHDGSNVYVDGEYKAAYGTQTEELNGKYKFPADTVLGSLDESMPLTLDINDATDMLESLYETGLDSSGMKVYIDDSDAEETKVKVSMDFNAFMDEMIGSVSDLGLGQDFITELNNSAKFNAADMYFSFNKTTGLFTGYGVVNDVSIKGFEYTDAASGMTVSLDVSVNTSSWLLYTDKDVEAPADLDAYTAAE